MRAVLAHHHHLRIGVPAHHRDTVHHRPAALAPPLLSVHVVVSLGRPLLADPNALLQSPLLEVVLGPVHDLLLLEGEDVRLLAHAHLQEGTVPVKTGAAIVGVLRRADAVFPGLQHHPQVVHLRPSLDTVVAEAGVLEVGGIARLALVLHRRVAEILGNAIGLRKKSVVLGEVPPLQGWTSTSQNRAPGPSIRTSLKIHEVN